MDPHILQHMQNLYGLNPDAPHMALGFPRLPPLAHKRLLGPGSSMTERLGSPRDVARADMDGFAEEFRERTAALVSGDGFLPAGHPLSNKKHRLRALVAENQRLQQENQDLKQKLAASEKRDQFSS